MKYQARNLERIAKEISSSVEDHLNQLGFFFRVFYRCKTPSSTEEKIKNKRYESGKNLLTDLIGIRINLYFSDDLEIVDFLLRGKFSHAGDTIDKNETTEFKPTRHNLLFTIPESYLKEFNEIVQDDRIRSTFELQLRTVLSEGWHEVDHDLRYKCNEDWIDNDDLSRMFNGILASLETSDWSILKLFEQLSYEHYKAGRWEAMIRTKFRLRIIKSNMNPDLFDIINSDREIQRQIFKIARRELLLSLLSMNTFIPISIENLLYAMNFAFLQNAQITAITPEFILKEFKLNPLLPKRQSVSKAPLEV